MARDLLLEIGVEELPSAYLPGVVRDMQDLAEKRLTEARLHFDKLDIYATPRRLVMSVKQLSELQDDTVIENRGPKKEMAFDQSGQPTKACQGFARGQGVAVEELQVREVSGVEYVFAVKNITGQESIAVLPEILTALMTSLPFPKSMRWGYFHTRFARPVRWILALFGDQVIPLQIENIVSGSVTYGHRFLSQGSLNINRPDDYFKALAANYVVLDQQQRQEMIWEQVQKVAADAGGKAMENEDLLEEITYLVEYPTAFTGRFSESYLQVPPEVLTTSMIEHQRYFPVYDQNGRLLPVFVGVRNGVSDHLETVRAGNERVLKARLEDALFFWNEDNKKPLEDLNQGLPNVLFQEKLGSLEQKVRRLEEIALYLSQVTSLGQPDLVKRAAWLSKADLLSSMVYEFPELQGIMGRYYAVQSGETKEVAQAIFEHYLPRFAGDMLPTSDLGVVISLAEKLHNLVGCFSIGIKPTGSQDPYALRRQALGIVHILLDRDLDLDLKAAVAAAYDSFAAIDPDLNKEDTVRELFDFILQRMKGVLSDQKYSYDVIDAVLAQPSSRLTDIYRLVQVIKEFKEDDKFEDLMVVFNRSYNLSKKWDKNEIDPHVLVDESEKELYKQLLALQSVNEHAFNEGRYHDCLINISLMRTQLDRFFEAVMVMVDDEQLKSSRLGILKSIAELCYRIADFSKIVQ